jgi:hypothetical protein
VHNGNGKESNEGEPIVGAAGIWLAIWVII